MFIYHENGAHKCDQKEWRQDISNYREEWSSQVWTDRVEAGHIYLGRNGAHKCGQKERRQDISN